MMIVLFIVLFRNKLKGTYFLPRDVTKFQV